MKQDKSSDIISKFRALDREEKLKIVNLIAKDGEDSVTDVRKKLNLSFSTTHKYLNELEDAGILKSSLKTIGGRQKRMYSLTDFQIILDPLKLSSLQKPELMKKEASINIVDSQGLPQKLGLDTLRKTLMDVGIPVHMSEIMVEKILDEAYDGMSIGELKSVIMGVLTGERSIFDKAMMNLSTNGFFGDQALTTILRQKNLELPVEMYMDADIDIYNVGVPKPISILHDLRAFLKYGIVEATPPNSLEATINHIRTILEMTHTEIVGPQAFNHLNIFLAPYASKLIYPRLKQIMRDLINVYLHISHMVGGSSLYYCLDLTIPSKMKKEPAVGLKGSTVGVYGDYESEAQDIVKAILETIGSVKFPCLIINLDKNWENSELNETISEVSKKTKILFSNLNRPWQNNASYFHEVMRFEIESEGFAQSSIGNCQTTTINLPGLVYKTKDESDFLEKLGEVMNSCFDVITTSAESITGKFYTSFSFLPRKFEDKRYFNLDEATYAICTCGMNEVTKKILGSQLHEDKASQNFVVKTLKQMQKIIEEKQLPLNVGIAEHTFKHVLERFARRDLKDFGNEVYCKGTKENPTYTSGTSVAQDAEISLEEKIKIEEKFHPLQKMGHMCEIKKDRNILDILKLITKSDIGYATII